MRCKTRSSGEFGTCRRLNGVSFESTGSVVAIVLEELFALLTYGTVREYAEVKCSGSCGAVRGITFRILRSEALRLKL